jgi:hypothetical protein
VVHIWSFGPPSISFVCHSLRTAIGVAFSSDISQCSSNYRMYNCTRLLSGSLLDRGGSPGLGNLLVSVEKTRFFTHTENGK